jgi:glycosyltransferase involved in cell wall biosynthesis
MPADHMTVIDNPRMTLRKARAITEASGLVLRHLHTRVVAISHAVASASVAAFGLASDRVTVIYRAISSPPPARRERREGPAKILHVGRLAPEKGHRYLFAAMRAVRERHLDAKLLLVGDGPLASDLRELARQSGLERAVEFLGIRNDVPELMATCDVFAFPSLFEGFGVSCMQAAAHGMPCVVSDVGALREVIEPGDGIHVPPCDADALGRGLLRMLDDPEAARTMGLRAQQKAIAKFGREAILEQWSREFERSAGNERRPRRLTRRLVRASAWRRAP